MSFYGGLQSTANQLLNEYGQPVTFSYEVGGTYDPVNGATTVGTTETQTVQGVVTPFNNSELNGTTILAGDLRVLSGEGFEPKTDYIVTVGENSYRVMSVEQVNPAGTPVLFKSQVRK